MNSDKTSPDKPVVLVVDDTPSNLSYVGELLKDEYRVKVAASGARALEIVHDGRPPDLILLDVVMPAPDGYEVCRQLKRDPRSCDIPVIFATSRGDVEDESLGFALGAVDYIAKPISPPLLMARLRTHLALKAAADRLRDQNATLEDEVVRRTAEVRATQDVTILALACLAETRDNETGNHILRTQYYVRALAQKLADHPRFRHLLDERNIDLLFKSAPLHDIGKVGIPDRILLKPGRLDADEMEIMKTHTTLGHEALVYAEQRLGASVQFLRFAKEIALSHQEKWDGSGYPQALVGDAIPISARLMAVADVYDALISRRVYKPPFPHAQALDIIREGRGQHFDPDIVDAFLSIEDEILEIARQHAD